MNADIHTLTGAYALDALSDTERVAFERHLAECASCSAEVAELQETAGRLGIAASAAPPVAMKAQVLSSIRQVRQLPPGVPARPGSATRAPLTRSRWQLWTAAAAAAACFAVAVVLGAQWISADRQLDQAAQTQRQLDGVLAVLAAPDAEITTAAVDGSRAAAVVSHAQGRVVFVARDMPQLPADRSYQAWLAGPGGMTSLGVLATGATPAPLVAVLLPEHTGIGVTVEPLGGSSRPSGAPVMEFELP